MSADSSHLPTTLTSDLARQLRSAFCLFWTKQSVTDVNTRNAVDQMNKILDVLGMHDPTFHGK